MQYNQLKTGKPNEITWAGASSSEQFATHTRNASRQSGGQKAVGAKKSQLSPGKDPGGWLKETKQKLMTVELQKTRKHALVFANQSVAC